MCSALDFSNIFLAFMWRMAFMEERVKGRKQLGNLGKRGGCLLNLKQD